MVEIPENITQYANLHTIDKNPPRNKWLVARSWYTGVKIKIGAFLQKKPRHDYIVDQIIKKTEKLSEEQSLYLLLNFSPAITASVVAQFSAGQDEKVKSICTRLLFKATDNKKTELLPVINKLFIPPTPSPPSPTSRSLSTPLQSVAVEPVMFKDVLFKDDEWKIQKSEKQGVVCVAHSTKPFQLHLVRGSITGNYIDNLGVAVNAANNTMFHGGGGTNKAFSDVIPKIKWESDVTEFFSKRDKKQLDVSECALFEWSSENKTCVQPQYFAQLLGPIVDANKKLAEQQGQVYQAYKNLFNQAREKGVRSVQMPFLSCGIYAANLKSPDKEHWFQMVDQAIFKAISEEMLEKNGISTVVLVDYNQVPWNRYIKDLKKTNE